jgi:hypothetical protein
VRAEVEQDPAAVFGGLFPACGFIRVDIRVMQVSAPERHDLPEPAAADQLLCPEDRRGEPVMEHHRAYRRRIVDTVRDIKFFYDPDRLVRRDRKRFFAVYMLARVKGFYHCVKVINIRRANIYHINFFIGEYFVKIRLGVQKTPFVFDCLAFVFVS